MRTSRPPFASLLLLSLLLGVPSNSAFAKESKKENWSQKMRGLYQTLAEVLTDVSSGKRFNDPANRKRIEKGVEKLEKLSHGLKKDANPPDPDPSLPILTEMLASETKRARSALQEGHREYARTILRTIPSYCVACHTRNATGLRFSRLELEPATKSLSPYERAEFFAATRQFDRADSELRKLLEAPAHKRDYWEWRKALFLGLSIAVRVKNDPQRAEQIVESVLRASDAPFFMKEDAKAWKKSIADWKSESGRTAKTPQGLRAEAARLYAKARESQAFPMDRTADIAYLRSASSAHDFLQVAKDPLEISEGLLLAGTAYEVMTPLQAESLHENFYEMCIRRSPHTPVAEICYRRIEESIILGYTGSAGTDLPIDAEEKLSELRKLAKPVSAQKPKS